MASLLTQGRFEIEIVQIFYSLDNSCDFFCHQVPLWLYDIHTDKLLTFFFSCSLLTLCRESLFVSLLVQVVHVQYNYSLLGFTWGQFIVFTKVGSKHLFWKIGLQFNCLVDLVYLICMQTLFLFLWMNTYASQSSSVWLCDACTNKIKCLKTHFMSHER